MKSLLRIDKDVFHVNTSLGTASLFSLGIPILLENILSRMLSTVNTFVLSGFSDEAVAAVGAVVPVIDLFLLAFYAVSTGATVVISHYIGTEKPSDAAKANFSAIAISLLVGVALAVTFFCCDEFVIDFLNVEGIVKDYAYTYYRVRVLALPTMTLSAIFLAILRCYGYTKVTVFAGISANIVNLILSALAVYLLPPSRGGGVFGVALACVISQTLSLTLGIVLFKRKRIGIQLPTRHDFVVCARKILKVGVPGVLSSGSLSLSQVIITPFIASLGTAALSAKAYFGSILGYTYLFSFSMGSANALLIGRLCGAKEHAHADRLNRQLVRITCVVNLAVSVSVLALRIPLLSFFTDNTEILKLSFMVFLVDILAEQARAVSQVYEYALRAAGDVLFSTVVMIISCWVCGVGLSYFLSIPCGFGLVGIYIAIAADETVRACCTVYRWKTNKWRQLQL